MFGPAKVLFILSIKQIYAEAAEFIFFFNPRERSIIILKDD